MELTIENCEVVGRRPYVLNPLNVVTNDFVLMVTEIVCRELRLTVDQLKSKCRAREHAHAKAIITKICIEEEAKTRRSKYNFNNNKGWSILARFFDVNHASVHNWMSIFNNNINYTDFKTKYIACKLKYDENNSKNRKGDC